ncbi:hypothetical protein AVEN_259249-1 [Araneus ventricosus]|uniref:DNA-directed DNA polymerase n=1 Tax=Araneus ventricosus TaxID=182803 RepID=A0A4Y2R6X7_ARAVE|nr:hypothetical protein AVEN_259249-1 [Araneus ventricosus]
MQRSICSPHRDLLLKKGIYPYEYMSSFSKFEETQLPPRSPFQCSLVNEGISEADCEHAPNVWKCFNFEDLGEYHDLFSTHADFSGLGIASSIEDDRCEVGSVYRYRHLFIEKGIRRGVSMISHRHSEANHPQCPNYDASEANKYITYLDANNLYGRAMSQPLPVNNFEWLSPEEISLQQICQTPNDATTGCILEVDMEYPPELHDLHINYPLAPERMTITPKMLSPTALNILNEMKVQPALKSEKLVPNFCNKQNYVLQYRNLNFYISLGLKLTKIHLVMKFTQRCWLKDYINFNTEQRKHAKTAFEKDFFKLLNNAVYGKTMEHLRYRVKVDIVQTKKRAEKFVASPAFHAFTIFDENLVAVQRKLTKLCLILPIQVGFVMLELSKVLLYDFHYNVIMKKYGDKARLLVTDTHSL